VPKVACFAVAGIELWFNSNDHRPPHFHAEKPGEWEVRVFFLSDSREMFDLVYPKKFRRMNRVDLKEIGKQADARRFELLQQWKSVVNVKTPGLER
jgi:hypothetical protein